MGPCMCGGCRRCLHDQGYHCGDESCCGLLEPKVTYRIRFDPAYGEQTSEGGFRGHDDSVLLITQVADLTSRDRYAATREGILELLENVSMTEE